MNATCDLNRHVDKIILGAAPDLVYLESLEDDEVGGLIEQGDIIYKDGDQVLVVGGNQSDQSYPDGYDNVTSTFQDLWSLKCRVLEPGESFTVTIMEE